MKNVFLYFLFFLPLPALTQPTLRQIPLRGACFYTGNVLPRELFVFKSDSVAVLCAGILQATGVKQNFDLLATNVSSVTAVVDSNGQRYLLYSRRYFLTNTDRAYQVAMLAHEIGHHANEHSLTPERHESEEVEADEFMGFALYRMGIVRPVAEMLAGRYLMTSGMDTTERNAAILRGFDRGEASIIVTPHAAFDDNGTGNAIPGIPEFPFPPPQPSSSFQMSQYFGGCATLAAVEQRLHLALDACGYYEKRFFYVKNGFALITRMEQIQQNGYPLNANRWNAKPVREEVFSLSGFLSSLFTSQPGYFRVFAFIATEEPFVTRQDRKVTREDASAWLNEGCFKLPPQIGQIKFTPNTSLAALVYEFQLSEGTRTAIQSQPSALDGETHLRCAKILSAIK